MTLPESIADEEQLEDRLSEPSPAVVDLFRKLPGDVLVLGVGGKMGPSLARMARRAADAAGGTRRVIGVARFRDASSPSWLERHGVESITADLLDEAALARLPDAPNIVFMAGMKFGATGNEGLVWAANTHLPALVCRRFPHSRIAAFSTGNVYGLVPVTGGGSRDTDAPNPLGEYAMSCLGRERIFEHFSRTAGTPVSLIRLNYAGELRYGVLVDIARQVWNGETVDLTMGHFNTLWQGDANAHALLALGEAASPPCILNVTGPEILSVREVALRFGELLGRSIRFSGVEANTALLNDASGTLARFGGPRVPVDLLLRWLADWVRRGGSMLGKPTHFSEREGHF